ncbi:protein IQ-DOMAIN 1 isoform X2 [Neltuma alba]|uniref:protein IQ-DOMAIN 1 isoform X2 n=1 Tax=Neltuma alba TaxID=207710 RepID=UPI0010A43AA0|nr:protein IQ-DOMAIN 1-like isoform X2 [Prosopis alba]XP_028766501.1 protein IQ-DOMAIN 1-like isoform X2 [Prosopis alba]XP_028766502.1 protein IQ-DOMAIN 1-like isoform X2 [Prosopis alba]XP_028766503.1 protein IQ-DOMAIN 1-like isoform X2 [Prosopis alba]
MGSGNWFKTMICLGKTKGSSKKSKGSQASGKPSAMESNNHRGKGFSGVENGARSASRVLRGVSVETIAATRIQTAYRAYKARKSLRRLKGFAKLKIATQRHSVKKQADTTLSYLHEWSKIQSEIRARRICMVTEDRVRRKKLESQQKLEAKLHDLEVEWCGGPETMEEILARIHYREEAAVKRERALAYAFSHQWRSNSSQNQGLGNYELNKGNWGWSWKDRWIAARPWESRVANTPPRKAQTKQASKVQKDKNSSTPRGAVSFKPTVVNPKARRLSYSDIEKNMTHEGRL